MMMKKMRKKMVLEEQQGNGSSNVDSSSSQEVQCGRVVSPNFGKLTYTKDTISTERRWEEMEYDILVKIFLSFDLIELTSAISQVCRSWRLASRDPILWKTLDLGALQSKFIKIPSPPYIWVAETSDKFLMRTLETAMSLSCGNASCLIFRIDLYPRDAHLVYIAERSPHLKRLVLPAWNCITMDGIHQAICKWAELESLTMPSIKEPSYILEEIGMNCKNLTQLKVMGPFELILASAIATYLPKLKVLSLRCSLLQKEALDLILDNLVHLEVLNISHCLFVEKPRPRASKRFFRKVDESIILKASRLQAFLTCQDEFCVLCERMRTDEGYLRWYKCPEGLWRKDEVSVLSC